jgi:spore germination cell wall hydrolase CwlJ-like protein
LKLSSKLKTVGKLKTLVRSISICLVFVLLASIAATLEAKSYPKQSEMQNLSKQQLECLSKVAYFESKGESDAGMLAVIHTTLNRVKDVRFPKTVCGVVYQKSQYSWTKHNPKIKEKEQYERAKRLSQEVVDGKHIDNTRNALYFVHVKINRNWLEKLTYTCTIGNHKFFK